MGLTVINPDRYGRLLAKTLPKVIETEEEFDRMVARLEDLEFAEGQCTPEEHALRELLARLIQDYDDRRHPLPMLPPRDMLRHLMEHRGLRQRDLVVVFGSSSVVSDVIHGKRAISKTQARRLGELFHVSAELFI